MGAGPVIANRSGLTVSSKNGANGRLALDFGPLRCRRLPDLASLQRSRLSKRLSVTGIDCAKIVGVTRSLLHALKAETVLFCGVLTNQCVAATSKDANFRIFALIVVREAVGPTLSHLHEPALEMMAVGWSEARNLEDAIAKPRGHEHTAARGG